MGSHAEHIERLERSAVELGATRARARYFTSDEVAAQMEMVADDLADETLRPITTPAPEYVLRLWLHRGGYKVITMDAEIVEMDAGREVVEREIAQALR
jgi:hypothetical protein